MHPKVSAPNLHSRAIVIEMIFLLLFVVFMVDPKRLLLVDVRGPDTA
jgi:hypothetical protein